MGGRFPELAFETESGVQAHPALDAREKEAFSVDLGIGGAQVERALGKTLGRGFTAFNLR